MDRATFDAMPCRQGGARKIVAQRKAGTGCFRDGLTLTFIVNGIKLSGRERSLKELFDELLKPAQ